MLLDWIAPPECPTEHAVVSQVTALAGEALVAQPLLVRARVERGGARRFRLELRIGAEGEGARTLESDDCAELAQATALIVSFDLQSRARAAGREGAPETGADTAPARGAGAPPPRTVEGPTELPPRREDEGAVAPPRPTTFGLGADAFLDAGSLPTGAWGSGVMAFFTQGLFRGELSAALWPRSRALATDQPGAGASLYLRTIGLRGCIVVVPTLNVDACLRAEGGSARATGFGITRPTTSNGRWLAAFFGITARPFAWGELAPRFTLELGAPVHFASVSIEGLGLVHTPSPVVLRVGAGLESKLF